MLSFSATLLLTVWGATTLWALSRAHVSLALVALQVWLLLDVVLPGVSAARAGVTMIGPFDFTAGTSGALRLALVVQVAVWCGAALARLGVRTRPVRVAVDVPAVRLDRWMVGLLVCGVSATVLYTVTAGAPLTSLNALLGGGRYGDLERASDGTTVKALKAAGGLAGASMLVATLRLAQGRPLGRWVAVAALGSAFVFLGVRGARVWLVLPLLACALMWWKTSRRPALRGGRFVLVAGAAAVFALAALVAGLRGPGRDDGNVTTYLHREATTGVFAPLAGLVDSVPERAPYLHGRSYLEALAIPVPRALWAGKPEGVLREQQRTFITRDIGASVAFPGELYANGGWVAGAVGCAAFAFLLERTWLRFARTRRLDRAVLLAAVLVVLLQVFSRSNLGAQAAGQLGLLGGAWWVAQRVRRCTADPVPIPAARDAVAAGLAT
jgi:hypothetical protein